MVIRKRNFNIRSLTRILSAQNLTQKAYLNALAAMLDYGARLVIAFLLNPLMVSGLGDYFYGVWQISRRLAGYLSIGGGRPTQALKWTVAYQQTSTAYDRKRRDVGSAVAVSLLFLPLLAVLGSLLVWFAPTLLHTPAGSGWIIRVAIALLVIDLLVTDLADVPQSVLRGENLGYQRMGLSALLLFVGGVLMAAAIYAGAGLIGIAGVTLLMTLLTGAFFLQMARRYVPWFGIARPTLTDVRRFFSLSWWFIGWRLVQQAMVASDVVVLGLLDSIEIVTLFSLTKFAPDALTNLMVTLVGGITPGLGGVIGSGDLRKAASVRNLIMAVTWLVITASGATILLWSRNFINLWVGPKYDVGALATLLIMVMTAQLALIRVDADIINLTLDLAEKVQIGVLSIVIALGLAAGFIYFFNWGIPGLCLGFIVGRSVLSVGYPWSLNRFLGQPFGAQLKSTVRLGLVTTLLWGCAFILRDHWLTNSWLGLIFSAGVTLLLTTLFAFYVGLPGEQRRQIGVRLGAMIR